MRWWNCKRNPVGISCVVGGFPVTGSFWLPPQQQAEIVHTRKSTGNIRLLRLFKNSVNLRRDGKVVREISSAFLGLWAGFPVLGYT
jgi:hypothetical protein